MSKALGRIAAFGIAKEGTRGTVEATADFYIPFDKVSLDEKKEFTMDEASRGVVEDSVGQSIIKEWAEGTIEAPVGDAHFPLILNSLFGTLTTTDNADSDASVKDHTISVAQSAQHQALSLFVDDPAGGQDYKHALGVVDSVDINYEQGKFLSYTASFKSKKGADATLTPSYTAENRFLPQHFTFKMASAQSGLTAGAATVLKSANIKISQNIEDDTVLGSTGPADFLNKQFSVEGTIEALWDAETIKDLFMAGTTRALRFDLKNTDVTIGSAANPQILIDVYKATFTELTRPFEVNNLIMQTISFKGHYSTSDSAMIKIVATNTTASY